VAGGFQETEQNSGSRHSCGFPVGVAQVGQKAEDALIQENQSRLHAV